MIRVITLLVILLCLLVNSLTPSFKISKPSSYELVDSSNRSSLYRVVLDGNGTIYTPDIFLLNLVGSRKQVGYDYGKLLGHAIYENYYSLLHNQLPEEWEVLAFELFLDWQWNRYLSKQIPVDFVEEIMGIDQGAKEIGVDGIARLLQRSLVISNFPGDIESNIEWLIYDEQLDDDVRLLLTKLLRTNFLTKFSNQCSFMGVWGSRTEGGKLYTMRNLDWQPDTGISQYKLVTIYHIDNVKYSYATVGFAGLIGALTGISEAGITVHEAGNDVTKETFLGFQWTLRLRYIMENSQNLQEAKSLWEQTNNTLGMNHMIASSTDVNNGHAAYALETMARYTAYFQDNDPREANLTYTSGGQVYNMGAPLKEALWRTNHGYDPTITGNEIVVTKPDSDSEVRYWLLHDSFVYYQNEQIQIGYYEAINITSILGDKGSSQRESFFVCPDGPRGTNILSVTYIPQVGAGTMFAAWEFGTKETWRPACCGTYVQFDLKQWW